MSFTIPIIYAVQAAIKLSQK